MFCRLEVRSACRRCAALRCGAENQSPRVHEAIFSHLLRRRHRSPAARHRRRCQKDRKGGGRPLIGQTARVGLEDASRRRSIGTVGASRSVARRIYTSPRKRIGRRAFVRSIFL